MTNTETDSRFPSGKWTGFFLDRRLAGRHRMELEAVFANGRITATGRDRVGSFTFSGSYDLASGECNWLKHYLNAHGINYRGFNEGKGIWGTWELRDSGLVYAGGFHIWPEGMNDPTAPSASEEAEIEDEIEITAPPELAPLRR